MNGVYFHPEIADNLGKPPPHFRYAVRAHHIPPWCIRGPHEIQIGRYYDTAREAWLAIREWSRQRRCTVTVRIFTSDAQLWRESEIAVDGTVRRAWPVGD